MTPIRPETSSWCDDTEDSVLVHAARAGDKDAFAALVNRHRPMALALVARLLGHDDVAADAVQEAAVAALVSLERLRAADRFGPWFCGIALNVARHWRREAVALVASAPDRPDGDADPHEAAEAAAVAREVQEAVAALAPGQREAVLAFYWGDRSHVEAAAELGITAGAVKARLHQARASLLPRLAHHATPSRRPTPKEIPMTSPGRATGSGAPTWVRAEVVDVRRSDDTDPARRLHVVLLGEAGGSRSLPIYVGAAEATALACTLESVETPRPLTYAMAAALVRSSGARVVDVRISNLAERVFYAVVRIDGPGGASEVDARPSDAVNLALVCEVPVLVDEALLSDGAGGGHHWQTAWQGFPSAVSAIAGEVRERNAELEAIRCEEGSPGVT